MEEVREAAIAASDTAAAPVGKPEKAETEEAETEDADEEVGAVGMGMAMGMARPGAAADDEVRGDAAGRRPPPPRSAAGGMAGDGTPEADNRRRRARAVLVWRASIRGGPRGCRSAGGCLLEVVSWWRWWLPRRANTPKNWVGARSMIRSSEVNEPKADDLGSLFVSWRPYDGQRLRRCSLQTM